MKNYIYQLITDSGECFYIGKTKDPKRRLAEHQRSSKTGHEDKYEFIRIWESTGNTWTLQVIARETCEHDEDWYVYEHQLAGVQLTNMRAGDQYNEATDALLRSNKSFSNATEFVRARQDVFDKIKAKRKIKKKSKSVGESVSMDDLSKAITGEAFESPFMKRRRKLKTDK